MFTLVPEVQIRLTVSVSSRHYLRDVINAQDAVAEKAFCMDDRIAISVQSTHEAHLYVLCIEQMDIKLSNTWNIPGEISCLSQFRFDDKAYVAVGSMVDQGPLLSIYSLDGELVIGRGVGKLLCVRTAGQDLTDHRTENPVYGDAKLEALTSLCIVRDTADIVDVVAGTRCGHLLTIRVSHDALNPVSLTTERLGNASVDVFSSSGLAEGRASAFATCDNNLIRLSALSDRKLKYERKDIVWSTDATDPSLPAPPIHSVFTIPPATEGGSGKHLLLLLGGTKLYVADVEPRVGPVPRSIPLGCTATRVMFSNIWKCLVVAVQKDKGVDLVLIDPDTGTRISKPLDAEKKEGYLTSFGHGGDKIVGLHEWKYVKDRQTFPFILVTMRSGKLVIVSITHIQQPDANSPGRRLEHWTRYRKKGFNEPVYSVVADDEGIIYCAGNTLYREVLDLTQRKLKPVKEYELESPATSLEIVDGKLYALTTTNSVEILDYTSCSNSREMILLHSDRTSRAAMHMTRIEHAIDKRHWSVTMLSDVAGGIVGLWVPEGQSHKDLVTVFEASLDHSVRRFVRSQSRPAWLASETRRSRFGLISSIPDKAEVLGVSVDGTLRHFRLLGIKLWRLLNLIQRLAQRSRVTNAVGIRDAGGNRDGDEELAEPEIEPRNMHIDGDVLGYCLEQRLLEGVVGEADCLVLFCGYLDELEGGSLTSTFAQKGATGEKLQSQYFELGYDILEYILAPVL